MSDITNYKEKLKCQNLLYDMKKIFVELQSHLRGVPSDHDIFINDIKSIDEISIDLCPIVNKCKEQYVGIFE